MKSKFVLIILSLSFLYACKFDKSFNKDLISGLTISGDGLSCDDVFLSNGTNRLKQTSFVYGEKFYLNFNDVNGFNKEDGRAFPGMELLISTTQGDTILHNNDLYANNKDGFDMSPLLLQSIVTAANPIHSNKAYKLSINIWDKKGKGRFKAGLDFDVINDNDIKVKSEGISYHELYLYSQDRQEVITDGIVDGGKDLYILFEGIDGFTDTNGDTFLGVKMKATDADGNDLVNEDDLMGDAPFKTKELKKQLAPIFTFPKEGFKNPISCEIWVWDKKGANRIKTAFTVTIK